MALESPFKNASKRLGSLLIEDGVLTEGQLAEALERKGQGGGFLGKILVDLGFVKENILISTLVKQCKIPHISLNEYEISEDLFGLIPKDICLDYGLLPIDKLGKILTVAMIDPLDIEALQQVRNACPDLRIKPILCSWQHYEEVARRVFQPTQPEPTPDDAENFGLPPLSTSAKKGGGALAAADRVKEAVTKLRKSRRSATGDSPALDAFIDFLEGHIRNAVSQGLESLGDRIHDHVADSKDGTLSITSLQLIDCIRVVMQEATDEAITTLLFQTQKALNRVQESALDLSVQDLADVLRMSIRLAIQDASGDILRRAFE